MANTRVPFLTTVAISLAGVGFLAQPVLAETVETNDYIYIGVEAEDFNTGTNDERWVVTDASTPAVEPDPDGNHSDTASGGVYLEVLPDRRVTHDDPGVFNQPDGTIWSAGNGPKVSYTVTFPEEGRYYVHALVFTTGTEDNGVHVGLNGAWPASGHAMQFCTSNLRAWAWGSAQRDSGGKSCGISHTIYLDVPTAGDHTVMFSAREDGFELDRFALIKDKSGNTRVCSATGVNGVSCRNGSIESADELVDLRLLAGVDSNQAEVGETVNVTLTLENVDAFDTATDIEVSVSAGAGATLDSNDASCNTSGSNATCTLASQEPTSENENELFEFSMVVSDAGEYVVEASVTAAETDQFPANNTVTQSIVFDEPAPVDTSSDVSVEITAADTALEVGDSTELTVVVANAADFKATGTNATVSLPTGVAVTTMPSGCGGGLSSILCTVGDIEANQSASMVFGVTAAAAGTGNAEVSINASNDQDSSNNSAALAISVAAVIGGETGSTDGMTDGETGTTTSTTDKSDGGSAEFALLLMLLLAVLARLYWLNQRKLVVLRQ